MHAVAFAQSAACLGRGQKVQSQTDALFFYSQSRDASERRRVDTPQPRLELPVAAPTLYQRPRADRHLNGIGGQTVQLDLHLVKIANGQKVASSLKQPRALIADIKHEPILGRHNLHTARAGFSIQVEQCLRAQHLRLCTRQRGAVQVKLKARRIQPLLR